MKILEKGMPEGIDMLNLNFPSKLTADSKVVVTIPTKVRMHNEVEKRTDPNGRPYYWYLGIECDPPPKSDAHEVFVKGNVSISPVILNWIGEKEVKTLEEFMKD